MRKLYVFVLLISLSTLGCHPKVDTTNPVVIQAVTLNDAEKTVNTISHGLLAAKQTVSSLETTEPSYYNIITPKLTTIASLNETANQCIITAVTGGKCDWQTAVINIAKQTGDPTTLTAFGFKNPNTQKQVQIGFATLIAGINIAIQFQQKAGQ